MRRGAPCAYRYVQTRVRPDYTDGLNRTYHPHRDLLPLELFRETLEQLRQQQQGSEGAGLGMFESVASLKEQVRVRPLLGGGGDRQRTVTRTSRWSGAVSNSRRRPLKRGVIVGCMCSLRNKRLPCAWRGRVGARGATPTSPYSR